MKWFIKLGMVLIGYVLAFFIAASVTYVNFLMTDGTQAQAASGMYAFGDTILFIGVFGLMAVVPSLLGLFFLRPFERFWTVLSVVALTFAATGLLAAATNAFASNLPQQEWSLAAGLGLARVAGAPLLALGFLGIVPIAPSKRTRWLLVGAALLEGLASGYFIIWLLIHLAR